MNIQPLAEYAAYQLYPEIQTERFQQALALICEHHSLELTHPTVVQNQLGLGLLIQALLLFSSETHFLKYNPEDFTIRVKSFADSLLAYQYNPFRDPSNRFATGQKPAAPGSLKKTDFLDWETFPENEHFLVWETAARNRYGILVQPVPIFPGHLIIASMDLNPQTHAHFDQVMTPEILNELTELQYALYDLGYAMGYNDRGAGASVDHFHTQAVPREYMPFIQAVESGRLGFSETCQIQPGVEMRFLQVNAQIPTLEAYPVPGILFSSNQKPAMAACKRLTVEVFRQQNLIFNTIGWKSRDGRFQEVLFPRAQEGIMNNAFKAGYVEMCGMMIMPQKNLFESIENPMQGITALSEAGLSGIAFANLTKVLKAQLSAF